MRWPFRPDSREEDLDEEIRAHLAIEIERRMERGETATEAASAAQRDFGNVVLVKEVTRGMWGTAGSNRFCRI